jgi:uncharacterized protein
MSERRDRGLDPSELNIEELEEVRVLGEGRFVIGTDDAAPGESEAEPAATGDHYVFDVTARVGDRSETTRVSDDDVGVAVSTLARWVASVVAPDVDPDEALGLLLVGGGDELRFPPAALRRAVGRYDVGPDDSVADLLAAVEDAGRFDVPARG